MSKFNGTEGAPIERDIAANWTRNYREKAEPDPVQGVVIKGHFFGREILQKILDQDGCMGIRMYYARDEKGQQQLILVGATAEGEDMTGGTIADKSRFCPPDCVKSELSI